MTEENKKPENTIFISGGKKDEKTGKFEDNFERYVNIIQGVYNKGFDEITLKARGSQITKAVNLALHRNFVDILEVSSNKIYAEEIEKKGTREGDDGKMIKIRVSSIDIVLKKKEAKE